MKKPVRAGTKIPQLSFVIPAFNEEGSIKDTIVQVAAEATRLKKSFEIIIIDDGSKDTTFEKAKAMGAKLPVRVLRLSRNFGKERALMAGLEASKGKAVVILDADLQEPISYLEDMLKHYDQGYEMVYAVRENRDDETFLKRAFTKRFYQMLSFGTDVDIPPDSRDFRIMDRCVVDSICNLPEQNLFMKGIYSWVGFKSMALPIQMKERTTGTSKFGFASLFKLAMTGLTSFTSWPLRIWTVVGMALALLSIFYGSWILLKTLIWGVDVPGFATITVAVFFLGGIQLMSVGIIGEYLARVFIEVKGRPRFIVAEETTPAKKSS